MSIVTELRYTANLDKGVTMTPIAQSFLGGDREAHRFVIDCYRLNNREAVDLSGVGVTGYFLRADGVTIPIVGETDGNKASVLLPAACYAVMGRFSLVIKLSLDDGTADSISTVFWGEGAVSRSRTDVVIDPDSVIPSLEELLAQIAAMEIATGNANRAAEAANAAATQAVEIATAKGDEALKNVNDAVARQDEAISQLSEDMAGKANRIEVDKSGPIVTVTDATAQPAVQLISHIVPVQEGEGDPSPDNVRPISGWDQASVTNDASGQTLTDDLPETVYGGTLDWSTGVLADRLGIVWDGTEGWGEITASSGLHYYYTDETKDARLKNIKKLSNADYYRFLCSHFAQSVYSNAVPNRLDNVAFVFAGENGMMFAISCAACATLDDFVAYLAAQAAAGTPLTCVFDAAAPTAIQLTPQQLDLLKGTNNVWSDCGDTSLVYVADSKMYIDNKFAELQNAILAQGANI